LGGWRLGTGSDVRGNQLRTSTESGRGGGGRGRRGRSASGSGAAKGDGGQRTGRRQVINQQQVRGTDSRWLRATNWFQGSATGDVSSARLTLATAARLAPPPPSPPPTPPHPAPRGCLIQHRAHLGHCCQAARHHLPCQRLPCPPPPPPHHAPWPFLPPVSTHLGHCCQAARHHLPHQGGIQVGHAACAQVVHLGLPKYGLVGDLGGPGGRGRGGGGGKGKKGEGASGWTGG
jgi:hypothetical protein